MQNSIDILKMRILISFLQREEDCTVTKIARTLGEEKYTISRALVIEKAPIWQCSTGGSWLGK